MLMCLIHAGIEYKFVKGSIADKELVDKLFKEYKFDVVVNLAAQAGVRYSIENPDAYIQSNMMGFYNILEACRHNPVEHLVYASSSSVYGGNKKVPFSTDDRVDNPVSLYAATKKSNSGHTDITDITDIFWKHRKKRKVLNNQEFENLRIIFLANTDNTDYHR